MFLRIYDIPKGHFNQLQFLHSSWLVFNVFPNCGVKKGLEKVLACAPWKCPIDSVLYFSFEKMPTNVSGVLGQKNSFSRLGEGSLSLATAVLSLEFPYVLSKGDG